MAKEYTIGDYWAEELIRQNKMGDIAIANNLRCGKGVTSGETETDDTAEPANDRPKRDPGRNDSA